MSRAINKESWKPLSAKSVPLPEEIEKDTEVWLFEVPTDFDVAALEGKKVNLADGHVIDRSDGIFSKQLLMDDYRTLSCKNERLLLPDNDKWRYTAPTGKISIIDYLDQVQTEQVPSAVIARCPKLPTGLKERYRPFGIERKSGRAQKASSSKTDVAQPNKHKRSSKN